MRRVCLIGDASGSNRGRSLIKFLAGKNDIAFYYSDKKFYLQADGYISYLALRCFRFLEYFISIFYIAISDVIYILPMGRAYVIERLICKVFRKRVVYDFYISHYDTYVNDRKTVKKKTREAYRLMKIDRGLFKAASCIIFLNNSERSYYLDVIGKKSFKKNSVIIPLFSEIQSVAQLPYVHSVSNSVTLCWWGSVIPLHGIDVIIDSAKILKDRGVNFSLYLLGKSDEKFREHRETANTLDLLDYVFFKTDKRMDDGSLIEFLSDHCDIALGSFGSSDKAKTVLLNKIVEASAQSLPVITQHSQGASEYFKDGESISFVGGDATELADKIEYYSKNKEKLKYISCRAQEVYRKNFTEEMFIKKLKGIL